MTIPAPPNPLQVENGVIRFLVAHYPTNADNTPPDVFDLTLYTAPCAQARAATLMANAGNVGCCTITMVTATYVFPPSPLVDGFPA